MTLYCVIVIQQNGGETCNIMRIIPPGKSKGHKHTFKRLYYKSQECWVDVTELKKAQAQQFLPLYIMVNNRLKQISAVSAEMLNTNYVLY